MISGCSKRLSIPAPLDVPTTAVVVIPRHLLLVL